MVLCRVRGGEVHLVPGAPVAPALLQLRPVLRVPGGSRVLPRRRARPLQRLQREVVDSLANLMTTWGAGATLRMIPYHDTMAVYCAPRVAAFAVSFSCFLEFSLILFVWCFSITRAITQICFKRQNVSMLATQCKTSSI